jgi:predicted ATPase
LWGKAGFNSFARSAMMEAQAHLGRALDLIASLPGTSELRRIQLELLAARADVFMALRGYSAPETCAAFEEAHSLIEQAARLGETPADKMLPFMILRGFWVIRLVAYDREKSLAIAAEYLAKAEEQEISLARMTGHFLTGASLFWAGDFTEARAQLTRARELYDPLAQDELFGRSGHDNGIDALVYRSWATWWLGYPDAAIADTEQALVEARQSGNAAFLLHTLHYADVTYRLCGDYDRSSELVDELASLAAEKNAAFWIAMEPLDRGVLKALTGDYPEAVRLIPAGLKAWRNTGATIAVPYFVSFLARAYAGLDQIEKAKSLIDEAIEVAESTGEDWSIPDIYRNAGLIALTPHVQNVAGAEAYFIHALEIARGQSAKSAELLVATDIARLWRDQGKRREAYELLSPIYNWFTEGFGTSLLKEAKALLDELERERN